VNPLPRLRKIVDQAERLKVYEAARADNDGIDHATHVWTRGGEIVGAASMAAVPIILGWHRSDKISARESFHIFRIYESVMDQMGFPRYWTLVNKASPYRDHMEKFGFKAIWETKLFVGGTGVADEIKNESLPQISEPPAARMR